MAELADALDLGSSAARRAGSSPVPGTSVHPRTELPMVVIMAGLPGTGKSTLARALALRVAGAVLDKDIIRAALFTPAYVEYSRAQDDFCQEIMLQAAAYLLGRNLSVHIFLDGRTFSRRYQRERVIEFCSQLKSGWAILECVCSEQTALARLEKAAVERSHPATNRTPDVYHQIRKAWEPIDCSKVVIDTEGSLDSCVERAMQYLGQIASATLGQLQTPARLP
jgi:predicted kinase